MIHSVIQVNIVRTDTKREAVDDFNRHKIAQIEHKIAQIVHNNWGEAWKRVLTFVQEIKVEAYFWYEVWN